MYRIFDKQKSPLIKKGKSNEKQRGAVIICHTPFQILNALNFLTSKQEELGKDNIIYISHEFAEAGEYSQRLRQTGLFHAVVDVIPFNHYEGIKHKLIALKRYVFPEYSLKKHLKTEIHENLRNNYKYLIFSIHSPLVSIIRLLYPHTDIIMIDDGIGSYFGNILTDNPSKLFRIIAKYSFGGALWMNPKALYLNSVDISQTTMNCEIYKLSAFKNNEKLMKLTKFVFNYEQSDEYNIHRLVYLDQPIEFPNSNYDANYIGLWKLVEKTGFGAQIIVRPHPRQKNANYLYYQQKINNLWELECINTIKNSHILMGIFSTAQFMPQILTSSESAVIFLYRLLLNESMYDFKQYDSLVDCLKKIYNAPEKIYVPQSLEELEKCLKDLF